MSQLITTYLQDHYAGSSAGLELFERVAEGHGDPDVRRIVGEMAAQVREDQDILEGLMERVGAKKSAVKDAATWVGEKVARLKPNDRLFERSPLSDLVELELLILGVHGKGLLWQGLLALGDERLDADQLRELADRAAQQEVTLTELRLAQVPKLAQS